MYPCLVKECNSRLVWCHTCGCMSTAFKPANVGVFKRHCGFSLIMPVCQASCNSCLNVASYDMHARCNVGLYTFVLTAAVMEWANPLRRLPIANLYMSVGPGLVTSRMRSLRDVLFKSLQVKDWTCTWHR
jgi:hypothetical protein